MQFEDRKTSKGLRLGLAVVFFLTVACNSKNPADSQDTPPQLPPESSLVMNFSNFTSNAVSGVGDRSELLTRRNWNWAVTNVVVWNVILTINLAVPVAAFLESFHHTPVQRDDGAWVWTYDVRVLGILHTAELQGKIVGDRVQWAMSISKENFYTDFLWFTGESNLDATEGTWTLNKDPNDPTPYIGIEWRRNPEAGTADIKYTNIIPGHEENGGFIFYGITGDTPHDAFYDIFNQGQNNHTNIEWARQTLVGRIMDPLHFGDSDWHCWDESQEDSSCE